MTWRKLLAFFAAAIIVAGCIPEKYQWSPDGKWMAFINDEGNSLQIADPNGRLVSQPVPGYLHAWFPDSQRLLVATKLEVTTWSDLVSHIPPDQAAAITAAGDRATTAALSYDWSPQGVDWSRFVTDFTDDEEKAGRTTQIYKDDASDIAIYMRDHHADALKAKLPAAQWTQLNASTADFYLMQIYNWNGSALTLGPTLSTEEKPPYEIRVSPTQDAVLMAIPHDEHDNRDNTFELWILATDGSGKQLKVTDSAAWYPDWTPDGKSIVFGRINVDVTNNNSGPWPSTIAETTVIGDDGKILDKVGPINDLAGILANGLTRVRCLKDGRIVFSSVEVTLPATPNDLPEKQELFALMPGKQATVSRLIPRKSIGDIGDAAQYFEISPDGSKACIPDGDTGKVMVVDLGSGEVKTVQDKEMPKDTDNNPNLWTVPTWRNSDELVFMGLDDAGKPCVELYSMSQSKATNLSATWPKGIVQKEQPAGK